MEAFHDTERFYDQMDKFTANYSSLRNKLVRIIGDDTHGPIVQEEASRLDDEIKTAMANVHVNFPTSSSTPEEFKDYFIAGYDLFEKEITVNVFTNVALLKNLRVVHAMQDRRLHDLEAGLLTKYRLFNQVDLDTDELRMGESDLRDLIDSSNQYLRNVSPPPPRARTRSRTLNPFSRRNNRASR